MRVVVLTEDAGPAARAVLQLGLRGVGVTSVVVAARPTVSAAVETVAAIRTRSARRVFGGLLRRTAAMVDPPARFLRAEQFEGFAETVVITGPLNTPEMVRELEQARPDLLLLTATGLVTKGVLSVPAVGTLNSHPGLLPWARGNGAVEFAVRRRIPVGVSVHHVDEGADTGDIVLRHLVPVIPADTLGSIRQKADDLRWMLLADVVKSFHSGAVPPRWAQVRRYPAAKWPTSAERAEAERLVREGAAYGTYCAWRNLAGGDRLPERDDAFDRLTVS